jgi:hypothetical protein
LAKINLSAIGRDVENKKNLDSQSGDYIDTSEKRKYDRDGGSELKDYQDLKEESED